MTAGDQELRLQSVAMSRSYEIKPGYPARETPEYFEDTSADIIWQPNVYREAADLAQYVGASTLVDFGCGAGAKLIAHAAEFTTIGIDYGSNIERRRDT